MLHTHILVFGLTANDGAHKHFSLHIITNKTGITDHIRCGVRKTTVGDMGP